MAQCYGQLCNSFETQGINLSNLDMMIAAHAVHAGAKLVSRDKAFQSAAVKPPARLTVEVW